MTLPQQLSDAVFEMKKNDLFTKLLLGTVYMYIKMDLQEKEDTTKEMSYLQRIPANLKLYLMNHPFTLKEMKIAEKFSKDEELNKILSIEVSYLSFGAELLRLWSIFYPKTKRPIINVSDKKLAYGGKAGYAMDMMKIKAEAKKFNDLEALKNYEEGRTAINNSVKVAKKWFDWHLAAISKIQIEEASAEIAKLT